MYCFQKVGGFANPRPHVQGSDVMVELLGGNSRALRFENSGEV